MALRVRRVRPDEGSRLRALRLCALTDAPWAFGSTLAREQAFAPGVWQERAARGAAGETVVTFVAEERDRWIGLVTGAADDARFDLFGMFVESEARGHGIGAALVEAVIGWARARGAARLHLGVTATNHPVIALYERCGFRPTGVRRPLGHTPALTVLEMARDL